jgi:plastocyanin
MAVMRRFLLSVLVTSFPAGLAVAAAGDHVVSQKGRAFHPTDVTINRGETLTFTNEDSFIHQIYADGLFDSEEKAPGENLNETFPDTGTFQVRCHIHPTMRMTVHVK